MYGQLAGVLTPIAVRVIGVLLILAVLVGGGIYLRTSGYNAGYGVATAEGQLKLNAYQDQQRVLVAKLDAQARATEKELQTKLLEGLAEKENEIKAINDHRDRLIGELRKRPSRGSSAPQPPRNDPKPATPQCPGTDITGKELSREDGEFLIGEATAADTLRHSLKMCRDAYQRLLVPKEKQ